MPCLVAPSGEANRFLWCRGAAQTPEPLEELDMDLARWTPGALIFASAAAAISLAFGAGPAPQSEGHDTVLADSLAMIKEGRETFRFETFGDEDFWGGQLGLHRAIAGRMLGGVGPGLTPADAVGTIGLKVDSDALPPGAVHGIEQGQVDLDDPSSTIELLRMDAVVGVKGVFDESGMLSSVGITCALCHSTVDDSLAPGMGHRLDGWANRDLNVGALVALAPSLKPFSDLLGLDEDAIRDVLESWGPGKFDAQLILDGKAFQPDGTSAATLIPPAFGLAGVNLHTSTGWGSVTYWNAFVAVLEMHGKGTFFDPRLRDATKFPIAAKNGFANVTTETDLVSDKLPALHFYQLALKAPAPPRGSFDEAAAERGDELFEGKADCARCHVEPTFSEPGWNLRRPDEIGIDPFQADRSPDGRYRTTPLKGLWTHQKGGFFHDGRFATLDDVVAHYDGFFGLGLTPAEKSDLVQYLLSL
jgi:hypothetical protein